MAQAEQTRSPARQRRRGEELEAALLESAWQELAEAGFAKMTMESVAARAKTGVAVLYRRWPNKSDLVLAAIRHYGATHPIEVPDTGNLRDDLIALLEGTGAVRVGFVAAVTAAFSGLLSDTGLTRPKCARRSWPTARSTPDGSSTGRTSAARSTSRPFPRRSSACRST